MRLRGDVAGLAGLSERLSGIGEASRMEAALAAAAEDVRQRALAQLDDGVPPDSRTGALAASLEIARQPGGAGFAVGTALDHGWHLEFGSLSRPAAPWLTPALDAAQPRILALIAAALANSARRSTS